LKRTNHSHPTRTQYIEYLNRFYSSLSFDEILEKFGHWKDKAGNYLLISTLLRWYEQSTLGEAQLRQEPKILKQQYKIWEQEQLDGRTNHIS